MRLLFALLALSVSSLAAPQQNIPGRNDCRPDSASVEAADKRLQKAGDMLDLAIAAVGGDAKSLAKTGAAETLSAKAEFLADRLVHLCEQVTCTDDGGHAQN